MKSLHLKLLHQSIFWPSVLYTVSPQICDWSFRILVWDENLNFLVDNLVSKSLITRDAVANLHSIVIMQELVKDVVGEVISPCSNYRTRLCCAVFLLTSLMETDVMLLHGFKTTQVFFSPLWFAFLYYQTSLKYFCKPFFPDQTSVKNTHQIGHSSCLWTGHSI